MNKLTYTKQIRGGKLRLTEMEQGASLVGTVADVIVEQKQTKDGRPFEAVTLAVQVFKDGEPTLVFTAGNVKSAAKEGKLRSGDKITITRLEDATTKSGRTMPFFDIQGASGQSSNAPRASQASAQKPVNLSALQARVEQIKANAKGN